MRHEDALLQLWVADQAARERRVVEHDLAPGPGSETPSLRQRAGRAVIAFGERLTGDASPARPARRLATRAS